ncbi:MAG: hypothetical protein Q9195_000051 [Heterodermia aff. obscurata]
MPERVNQRFGDAPTLDLSSPTIEKHVAGTTNIKKRKRLFHLQSDPPTQPEIPLTSKDSPRIARYKPGKHDPGLSRTGHPGLKERAAALAPARKKLPIWSHASTICSGLRNHDVMLIVGETGSGKSTQVPQMLVDEPWCRAQRLCISNQSSQEPLPNSVNGSRAELLEIGGRIAITEPRRVAAISLAERVAQEMGTPLGSSSPASKVGFSVRFNNCTSPSTRIKFLTEGMLLQEMLRDAWLRDYSAVVLDEVHERGVNVDLLLGFLRGIVAGKQEGRGGVVLKVVVMSATAEMQTLERFFEQGSWPESAGEGPVVRENAIAKVDLPDAESEWSGISSSDDEDEESLPHGSEGPATLQIQHVSSCHVEGRQYPVTIHYEPKPVQNWLDAMLRTIFDIHYREPLPGDVLVFLTGQETVETLEKLAKEHEKDMRADVPKLLILPLFAALPQDVQQAVFQRPPPNTRKIILATNIAETSVTVPGVRFVIDCGKAKIKHFRSEIGLESLLVRPISKSAAIQRMGRAGREAPGKCWRLYTEQDYSDLPQSNTPEILRCDLSQAILTMQARGIQDIYGFPFLNRPRRGAYEKALMHLFQLGALDETGHINKIGLQMAKLPLTSALARTLLAALEPEMDCVCEVIDIIACLSVENIFLKTTSEESREQAETARRAMYRREGDHLTLLATVQAYAAENTDRKDWCRRYFVSHRAMKAVMDVRKQLHSLPLFGKSLSADPSGRSVLTAELSECVRKCFIQGFAYNTALRLSDGSYKTVAGHQKVAIHPSSALFGKPVRAILFNEFVFTNKSYARGVSAVEMSWLEGAWKEPGVDDG